jgi:uroporphyrinogen-III synthase
MRRVLVTRQTTQAGELVTLLETKGFEVFSLPLIHTTATDKEITAGVYDYAVFTSPVAVEMFMPHADKVSFKKVISVGTKTAARLKEKGIETDFIPEIFSAEGMIKMFEDVDVNGLKFLMPGAEKRAGNFHGYLISKGAEVELVSTYKTSPMIYDKGFVDSYLRENKIEIITLTAPSAAESLLAQTTSLEGIALVSIGKTTWSYLKEKGHDSIYPEVMTIEGMTELIVKTYKGV